MNQYEPFLHPVESMMIEIFETSKLTVWNNIEQIKNPISRFQTRQLYFEAVNKLNEQGA